MFKPQPQSLQQSLYQLRNTSRLRAHAQHVADMSEKEVREEFILILDRVSKKPLAVRRFIVQLMKFHTLHQISTEKSEETKNNKKEKE